MLLEVKFGVEWIDYNMLLVIIDWGGDGFMFIEFCYLLVVKCWICGMLLEEVEILFFVNKIDVGVFFFILDRDDGIKVEGVVVVFIFFICEYYIFFGVDVVQLFLLVQFDLVGLYEEQLFFIVKQDWIVMVDGVDIIYNIGSLLVMFFVVSSEIIQVMLLEVVFELNVCQVIEGVFMIKG